MGSDLHMNPPREDHFRARWEGDVLIVERNRDGIYPDGGKWVRTVEAPVSQRDLDLIGWWVKATGGFIPPEKPSTF